ncbi:MAG TPA: IS91 family transposase [Candidatus Dormibacteraeota bacterium]|nr:IS91 family transposase [Candidatus Dormibacteraeota bacterium]
MARPALEVADIFRDHGAAWRHANRGHVSLCQLKVMSAIENCRTAALGGHVARCEDCAHTTIAYNSCRNRHCPKCQAAAAREWLAAREAELLPVPYFHVVFTLPPAIGDLAYQNKAVIYDLLFKASSEAVLTIAADPKHFGARIGITSVLHSWGSAMTHHPHVHMIVPGGGLSMDASRWISCKPNFLLPVLVLSKLFRRLMLAKLLAAHQAGRLQFFGSLAYLADAKAFRAFLAPLRKKPWFVYAKRPFAGPKAVLAYLARYTHRVAISNRRLIAVDEASVTFKVKDYRLEGPGRYTTMTLAIDEFIRRFLIHVLPTGFHRIRHYGWFASGKRAATIAKARELLGLAIPVSAAEEAGEVDPAAPQALAHPCPCCGGRMIVIETFEAGCQPRHRPTAPLVPIRIDTS